MKSVNDIKNKVKNRNARAELMKDPFIEEKSPNVNVNNSVNSNINANNEENLPVAAGSDLDAIISGMKSPKFDKTLVGIYFTPDVKEGLDKLQKAEGRGAKSDLLNELARYALKQRGYL